jgi:uncharacterized protein (DUF2252 family)
MKQKIAMLSRVKNRQVVLVAQRNLKMARSAHAYVRGNTLKFYEWLDSAERSTLPNGPPVWICGDCHLGNLGPVADAEGRIAIQRRDLDQTVIGNPAHDLIRLGLSLATAARGSDLSGVTTAHMLEQMIEGYESAFLADARSSAAESGKPKAVRIVLRRATARTWKHLARERLEDVTPTIPLGKRFWPLSAAEKREIARLFKTDDVRKLVTALQSRDDDAPIALLDAAYWMKGCSSLGRLRFAVLIGVGGTSRKARDFCLIDIKEAAPAVAPRYAKSRMPRDNGERIVTGARALSPFLGERMLASRFLDRAVFLRELLPQDLKLEIDQLTRDEAVKAARFLANVVGRAHASQMDAATSRSWHGELQRNRSKTLDAPSWLWSSIVELVVGHEAAYLDHCRRYAMSEAAA